MNAAERSKLLLRWADLIEQHVDTIARIEALNNGKPYDMAKRVDLFLVLECLRFFAGACDKIMGETIPSRGDYLNFTLREPVGVVGAIIPWNFPLLMAMWKMAPCLAAGNTLVLKTAEQTPLSALYAANLAREAGIPPGVLNILSGFGESTGQAIARHMDIDKISFTGSTEIGREIMRASAESNLKNVTLELGGKSPLVVLDDISKDEDLHRAVSVAMEGIFFNQGQVCTASSRVFVPDSIYDEFVERSTERAKQRIVGDPFDPKTEQGPQVSREQFDKILDYVKLGHESARVVTGGERIGNEGFFVQPTVIVDIDNDSVLAQEEIFGPVVCVMRYRDFNEVIAAANRTKYGLAAGVFTKSIEKAMIAASHLRAGTVWVNCWNSYHSTTPFGGMKLSGMGRDLGMQALHAYTEVKSVIMNLPGIKSNPPSWD